MLIKEECLKAIEGLKKYVNADNIDYIVVFKKLIDEHFCDENEKKIMLNAEKFRDEILSDEGNELNKAFSTCKENIGKSPSYNGLIRWLLSEYKEPILDEVEREYLSAVCRPYKVETICKESTLNNDSQWLYIRIDNVILGGYEYILLPYFNADTMYKGMELKKKYTPQELGIKCRNNPNGEIKHD